jgi:hypothetical protein
VILLDFEHAADEVMAFFLLLPTVLLGIMTVVFLCIGFLTMFKVRKMTNEKEYLEANCFH